MLMPKVRFMFVSDAYKIEKNPNYLASVTLGLKHVIWPFPTALFDAVFMPIFKVGKAILLLPLIMLVFLVMQTILLVAALSGRLSPIETEMFVSAYPPLSQVEQDEVNSTLNDRNT